MLTTTSTKFGLFTDIHIGIYNASNLWHGLVLKFGEKCSKFFREQGITSIIIPGDIFHNRFEVNVDSINTCARFFDYFKDFDIYILVGNHDALRKDTSAINSISILNNRNNIKIIETPEILKTPTHTFSIIPWGSEYKDIPKSDVCFGHFEINSFHMNGSKVCSNGVESERLFEKAPWIISGHFHKREDRKYSGNKRITYLGSPYQQNFGEIGQEHGVYIFDGSSLTFIHNEDAPVFIKLQASKIDHVTEHKNIAGNFIRLVIDKEYTNEEITRLTTAITSCKPIYFDTKYEFVKLHEMAETSDISSVDIPKSIETFVREVTQLNYKDETVKYLLDVYNKYTT